MISIALDETTIEEIKETFSKWFFRRKENIKEFVEIISNDDELRSLVFENGEGSELIYSFLNDQEHKETKKQLLKKLEEYFYADFSNENIVARFVKEELNFKTETKLFFERKYKNFRNSIRAGQIVRELNITVCPYCNRNYIEQYNIKTTNSQVKRIFKGDFDHYYSKSLYPHLALSLFNLIPCCKVCNHEKSNKNTLTFHPYYHNDVESYTYSLNMLTLEDKYDITFEEEISDIDMKVNDPTIFQGTSNNFKITIMPTSKANEENIKNSITVFQLEKKYNNSKQYVKELLKKRYTYNEAYAEMLCNNFKEIFENKSEVKRIIFSNELDNTGHKHRPLSKLTYDILNELDINDSDLKSHKE